jgi:hypothetical protein
VTPKRIIARDSTAPGRSRRSVEERGPTRKARREDRRAGRDRSSARLDVEIPAVEVVDGGAAHRRNEGARRGLALAVGHVVGEVEVRDAATSNSATDVAITLPEFLASYVMRTRARRFPVLVACPLTAQPLPATVCSSSPVMLTLENPFELESLSQPARSTTAIPAIAAPPTKCRMSFLLASRALGGLGLVSGSPPRR